MYQREVENLINAIIVQAKEDYVWSRNVLKNKDKYMPDTVREAEELAEDSAKFFASTWYSTLTSIPVEIVLEQCRKEVSA